MDYVSPVERCATIVCRLTVCTDNFVGKLFFFSPVYKLTIFFTYSNTILIYGVWMVVRISRDAVQSYSPSGLRGGGPTIILEWSVIIVRVARYK